MLLHNRFYSNGHSAQRIHDEVGRYYGLPRVCMGDVLYSRIQSGELSEEEVTPDGLHPNDRGHALLAELITDKLERMYRECQEKNSARTWAPGPEGEQGEEDTGEGHTGEEDTGEGHTGEEDIGEGHAGEGYTGEGRMLGTLPEHLTMNRYENVRRFRNHNISPVTCSGFTADHTPQTAITETFRRGWTAACTGDEISFEVESRCIALQYRRTVRRPAPTALAFVDGDLEHGVVLDGNFDEDWGDFLALQVLLETERTERHRVTVRITEAEAVTTPFYLVSVLLA